ncbi:cupin domain-containing protein [Streptomyces sp. NPDC006368]|uniref:cupin domain-containing protein n=1 Tax=Streptomyces sp. NPDC006368 TaxID=3156760 RepID=UPI0033B85D86
MTGPRNRRRLTVRTGETAQCEVVPTLLTQTRRGAASGPGALCSEQFSTSSRSAHATTPGRLSVRRPATSGSRPAAGTYAPRNVRLSAGDVAFLPRGSIHGMSDTPDRPLEGLPAALLGTDALVGRVSRHAFPDAGPAVDDTFLLCGAYRLERDAMHPFLRGLPDFVHISARPGRHTELSAAVDLLSADTIEDRPGADAALPALLDLVLLYALRVWLEAQCPQESGGWCAALKDPAVGAALDRLHRDPAHS